jgi:hypothetical protein
VADAAGTIPLVSATFDLTQPGIGRLAEGGAGGIPCMPGALGRMVWLPVRLLAHTEFRHHGRRANEIGCLVRHNIRIPYGACADRCAGYRKHQMSRVHAVRP